jgi:DNA-binding transcriptional ArsR family regulator
MTDAAGAASDLLKALAHPGRLILLCLLVERERSVGELAALLGARDSTVSQHLSPLRRDGLVRPRREGQTVWYGIASDPARRLLAALAALYCAVPAPVLPGSALPPAESGR